MTAQVHNFVVNNLLGYECTYVELIRIRRNHSRFPTSVASQRRAVTGGGSGVALVSRLASPTPHAPKAPITNTIPFGTLSPCSFRPPDHSTRPRPPSLAPRPQICAFNTPEIKSPLLLLSQLHLRLRRRRVLFEAICRHNTTRPRRRRFGRARPRSF